MRPVMKYMAGPITSGETSIAKGNGRLRCSSGLRGSANFVSRTGRARRGGRLKFRVGAPAVGETTALAAGTGPIDRSVSPTVSSASGDQAEAPAPRGLRSSSR